MADSTNGRLAVRDRFIYGILALLMAVLGFLASNIYIRVGTLELIVAKGFNEPRASEDHALLLSIEASRQQRITVIKEFEGRMDRLEQRVFQLPSLP